MNGWIVESLASVLFVAALAEAQAEVDEAQFRLGPGDVLNVVVWKNTDLTMEVLVRPDGHISLPLINDIKVKGLTPRELQQMLTSMLGDFITEPVVSVIVKNVQSFKVSILGAVKNPGRYVLAGPSTVLDVLAMAGGPTEYADLDDMFLLRGRGDSYDRYAVNYSKATSESGKGVNVNVEAGDIIVVP